MKPKTRGQKKKEIIVKDDDIQSKFTGEGYHYHGQVNASDVAEMIEKKISEKQQISLTAPSLELTQDNREQVILILLEEGYKVWEKEGLLYFEKIMV